MTPNRKCGGCTACCKTHALLTEDKDAGVWCKHCAIGQGCKIYSSRPQECADFKCGWLIGYGSENDRPDRNHVVLDYFVHPIINEETTGIWEVSEGALDKEFAQEVRRRISGGREPFMEVYLSGKIFLHLPEEFVLSDEHKVLLDEQATEVKRY